MTGESAYRLELLDLSRSLQRFGAFGRRSRRVATIATEWNGTATSGCIPNLPTAAKALLAYFKAYRIGLVAWAMDYPDTLFRSNGFATLTSYRVSGWLAGDAGRRQRAVSRLASVISHSQSTVRRTGRLPPSSSKSDHDPWDGQAASSPSETLTGFVEPALIPCLAPRLSPTGDVAQPSF